MEAPVWLRTTAIRSSPSLAGKRGVSGLLSGLDYIFL